MKRITLMLVLILLNTSPLFAGESIIFTGIPEIKISEGGLSRIPENINSEKALGYKCTISKLDDKYLWTTRENTELIPVESGSYITFLAVNGSGYIRVIKPDMKDVVKQMGAMAGDPEEKFDYVEHLLLGLKSITYYGTSK